ncbi:MAG TPA: Rne/Rng family ribonuclease [Thermoclostridium sp.]
MIKEILVDTKPGQTRIAILEDGELAELHIETADKTKLIGNIYRGKVERVLPGMQCAFVDIGIGKNAYLSADDVVLRKNHPYEKDNGTVKIENMVKQGQEITVQVVKDEIGTKGPKVTTDITLPGNLTVLYPLSPGTGVSKKIADRSERERLKKIAEEFCPEGMGVVIRTAAEGADESLIGNDVRSMLKRWELIKITEAKGQVPRCLYQEPGLLQKLAQGGANSNIKRIVLNDYKEFEDLLKFLDDTAPEMKMRVEFFYKDYDMFKFYNIDSAIKEALARKVWLKSGGYLVFDYTEALTVIDVNTGKYVGKNDQDETIFKTNCEAAVTIARQIRLRDISGIILIDFIDMKDASHKETVLSILAEECKKDGTQVVVVGMTNLGLVELTRKKVRNSLNQILAHPCPNCGGSGRIMNNV